MSQIELTSTSKSKYHPTSWCGIFIQYILGVNILIRKVMSCCNSYHLSWLSLNPSLIIGMLTASLASRSCTVNMESYSTMIDISQVYNMCFGSVTTSLINFAAALQYKATLSQLSLAFNILGLGYDSKSYMQNSPDVE